MNYKRFLKINLEILLAWTRIHQILWIRHRIQLIRTDITGLERTQMNRDSLTFPPFPPEYGSSVEVPV